jgi:hypothetical protein
MYRPETLFAIGFRAQAIVNSTSASTSWLSPRSAKTPRAGPITYASEPTARVTRKRCGASNGGYPTSSTDNSATTQTDWRQAREDTRGRLYRPARPAQTPHTDASDKSLPGPTESHPTTDGNPPLDTERRRLHARPTTTTTTRARAPHDAQPVSGCRRVRFPPATRQQRASGVCCACVVVVVVLLGSSSSRRRLVVGNFVSFLRRAAGAARPVIRSAVATASWLRHSNF